ncbi:unnamed protein product, partial [Discosporangium mesarthrocarpum]
ARGNFSHLEVACVMERQYYEDPESSVVRENASKQVAGSGEEFKVVPGDSFQNSQAVWWTRRGHLEGGAAAEGPGVVTLDLLVVVIRSGDMLDDLAHRGEDEEAFPDLGRTVDRIRSSSQELFGRLVLVLEGVEQEISRRWSNKHRGSNNGGNPCCSMEDLLDATSWLLIHKNTETRLTQDAQETGQYLWDMTRALSTIPYKVSID